MSLIGSVYYQRVCRCLLYSELSCLPIPVVWTQGMTGHPFINIHNVTVPFIRMIIHLKLNGQMLFLIYPAPQPSPIGPILNVEFGDTLRIVKLCA